MSKYNKVMMNTAYLFADQSYCIRRKVGAVLARDGRILITGYNGTISGMPNVCEIEDFSNPKPFETNVTGLGQHSDIKYILENMRIKHALRNISSSFYKTSISRDYVLNIRAEQGELITSDFTLHAEQNIICYAAQNGISTKGTTLYITTSPCKTCAKLIAQSGIKEVVYSEEYKDNGGIQFLKELGITVNEYKIEV